jgi:hypothetical protein
VKSRALLDKCEWFFSAAVIIGCLLSLYWAAVQLRLPYQLNYVEGIVLDAAVRLNQGETPYPPAGAPPFVFNQYGPLFYYLVAFLVKHFGLGFAYPRLLGFVSGLFVVGLLSLLLRRWTGSWKLSLPFALLYLSLPIVRAWFFHLRPDMIGVALTLAGLYVFTAFPHRWYLAVSLFVAAIFCKYTLVAAPAACFFYLLSKKEWRTATWLVLTTALPIVLIFSWLQQSTNGWFGFHMFWTHPAPLFPVRYLWLIAATFAAYLAPSFLAIVLGLHELSRRTPSLAFVYLVTCSLSTGTLAKVGADPNHLLEWLAALCLCAGLGYRCLRSKQKETVTTVFAVVALALFTILIFPRKFGPEQRWAECEQAYDYVKKYSGEWTLSDNVGALVLAGKPLFVSDPFVYGQLVTWAGWSDSVAGLVRSNYFGAIILPGDINYLKHKATEPMSSDNRWPLSFVHALEQNYRPVRWFECDEANVVFEPAAAVPVEQTVPTVFTPVDSPGLDGPSFSTEPWTARQWRK